MKLIFTSIFLIIASLSGYSQVSFTYKAQSQCAPTIVQFTNTSTQGNYYEWYINGETYTEENPSVQLDAGYFFPNLTVYDTTGGKMDYIGNYSEFFVLKGMAIQGIPSSGQVCVGEPFNLWAYADGFNNWVPVSVTSWDFGDGNTTTKSEPEYSYSKEGTYTITFKGSTDSCGSQTITREINVVNKVYFEPWLTLYGPARSCPNTELNFSTGFNSQPQRVEWNFGDGNTETLYEDANWTSHVYTKTGTFNYSAKIVTYCGNDTTLKGTIEIKNNLPVYNVWGISHPTEICPDDAAGFYVSLPGGGDHSYEWSFGDGAKSNEREPEHAYSKTGKYNVSVKITNKCGRDTTVTSSIDVNNGVGIHYAGIDIPSELCPGDMGRFEGFAEYGRTYDYSWDFGDGNTSDKANTTHSYSSTGTYNVSLKMTNGCGNDTTLTGTVEVKSGIALDPSDIDWLQLGDDEYCPGDPVTFVHFMENMQASINFGDGSPSTSNFVLVEVEGEKYPFISHSYSKTGTFKVALTITNGCGLSATDTMEVVISNNGPATIDPEWEDSTGNGSITTCEIVYFYAAEAQGGEVTWDFGDGSQLVSREYIVKHSYTQAGNYTVKASVKNGCGNSASDSFDLNVTGNPCSVGMVNKELSSGDFAMFPNPANSTVTVVMNNEVSPNRLVLYNLYGEQVYHTVVTSGQARIDLSGFASGVYLVKVQTASGQIVKKLVKE